MIRIKLYTLDDLFVAEAFVVEAHPMPDAVMWGSRLFARRGGPEGKNYHEIWCTAAFDERTLQEVRRT